MALEKNQREMGVCTVKLEVNPKKKKLAIKLGFDKSPFLGPTYLHLITNIPLKLTS